MGSSQHRVPAGLTTPVSENNCDNCESDYWKSIVSAFSSLQIKLCIFGGKKRFGLFFAVFNFL